ncbi:MAG: hypothetical protein K9H25_01145 [Rhodospirillum sp.]|nr:hypothetical protein [Rhodospirillum sp.]MCF8488051.1 hypothetical protein [Rhodospirillum sp.]MCF8501535.1 hypothetical protein [Rhodospirillum sp.]
MRVFPLVAVTATALVLATSPVLAEDLDFLLTNKSGAAITAFHVSHAGTDQWEENLMEGSYLPDGNEITVHIGDGRDVCVYDIRTEFDDGDVFEDYGLDLCELGGYSF